MSRKLALVLLAGCSMTPKYERPAAPVAASYPTASAGGELLGWRQVLGDPRLQALEALALRENRDLRVAVLNVDLARAQYRITGAPLYPTVNAVGAVAAQGDFEGDRGASYTLGVGVSSWELDLWGRIRSLKSAAVESYLATEEARRATHLALVAEVAGAYLVEVAAGEQLQLAEQTLAAVTGTADLTRRLFDAGQRSELDTRTAEAQVHAARAEVARLGGVRAQAQNALVLLVGAPIPQGLPAPLALAEQPVAEIPGGLPSELLTRRPDILAAEHQLKSANASIGAARAAFFPTISLTAFGGFASSALGSLFSAGLGWTFAPQITMPLFTGGRNQANLDMAWVRKRIEIASYEKAIQVAFREVADGLALRATLAEQLEAQTARVEAEQRRYELSEKRYQAGIESYLSVLDAQRDLYGAQQQLILVRLARLSNTVTLYKSLGGGWTE